jgi:hypothetical protein
MTHVCSDIATRLAQSAAVLVLGAALAACGTPSGRAEAIQETAPSVTFEYKGDKGLIDATFKAENYCRQFNSWPTRSSVQLAPDGGNTVTFDCAQPRTAAFAGAQPPPMPPNPTVQYTYRDERDLIDATTQAQRYCAGFGADARASTVTDGAGGVSTVVFECVRTR